MTRIVDSTFVFDRGDCEPVEEEACVEGGRGEEGGGRKATLADSLTDFRVNREDY